MSNQSDNAYSGARPSGIAIIDTAATIAVALPSNPLPPLDLEEAFRQWGNLIREFRRNDITIEVVAGLVGPMTLTVHPTDGQFVECSYDQAKMIDAECPLRLLKVLSPDRAQFTPAFPGIPFAPLIPPPYEVRS